MTLISNGLANAVPFRWTYTDATARAAASGFTSADLYAVALQLSDASAWMLTATTPTWSALAGTPGMINPMTTADDIIKGGASGTPTRVAKGANNTVWGVDGSGTLGYKADPAGGAVSRGTDAARPAAGTAGALYFPTDGYAAYEDNGTSWRPFGPLFPLTAPDDSQFAWVNQGGASVVAQNSGIFLLAPNQGAADNNRIRTKAAPATPYTVTAYLIPQLFPKNFHSAGLVWRQSSDGKFVSFGLNYNSFNTPALNVNVSKWTNPTTISAAYAAISPFMDLPRWFRLRDDGTTRYADVSHDGQNWFTVHSVGRTDFLTADQVGFYANANNNATPNYDCGLTVLSWAEA